MKTNSRSATGSQSFACLLLVSAIAALPSSFAEAQGNPAAMSVRKRVEGLGGGPESPPTPASTPAERPTAATATAGSQMDLSYVPANAVAVAVVRPAKALASPLAKLLPVEVISAYSLKYTGFDPTKVDEIVAFGQMPGESLGYGLVTKFNEPFKGSAIPPALRGSAKLGDLGGRRYLQASEPTGRSFYGPDNKTLIVAPDATLRQAVESKDQPKTGPLIDRVLAAPATSDVYVAIDVESLRPMMAMAQMYAQQLPPDAQQMLEAPNLITAAEFTFDLSAPSPMTLIVHANDEASAEKLEVLVQTGMQLYQTQMKAQMAETSGDATINEAWSRYAERNSGEWAPQREGAKLTFFRADGADAQERQLIQAAMLGFMAGKAASAFGPAPQPGVQFPGEFPAEEPPAATDEHEQHEPPTRNR